MALEDLEKTDSLRDTLVAAFKSETSDDSGSPNEAPAPKDDGYTAPEPKAAPKEAAPREPAANEAPKADPKAAAKPGEEPAFEPPVRWTKTQKEKFYSWPREVQQQVLEENKGYQSDYTRKSMELAQERKRYEGFEKVLAPRRQTWAQNGLNDSQALEQIMQYWDHAGKDPAGFIKSFAQQRGIDLAAAYAPTQQQLDAYFAQYYAGQGGQQPQDQAALHPAVQSRLDALEQQNNQLRQQIGQTQQYLGSREQQEQQRVWTSVADELRQFETSADASGQPAYPFFNEVREDMSRLIERGFASDLKDAYDKATRLRPDIFGKIQESQEVSKIRQSEQRRAAEAAAAKKAGASVSASSVGYTPSPTGEPLSLRDELERQFKAAYTQQRV